VDQITRTIAIGYMTCTPDMSKCNKCEESAEAQYYTPCCWIKSAADGAYATLVDLIGATNFFDDYELHYNFNPWACQQMIKIGALFGEAVMYQENILLSYDGKLQIGGDAKDTINEILAFIKDKTGFQLTNYNDAYSEATGRHDVPCAHAPHAWWHMKAATVISEFWALAMAIQNNEPDKLCWLTCDNGIVSDMGEGIYKFGKKTWNVITSVVESVTETVSSAWTSVKSAWNRWF